MRPAPFAGGRAGFTLVELLVAMSVLLLVLIILLSITSKTGDMWRHTTGKIEQFREARQAFESIQRRLSQATLNTYWDYDDLTDPKKYLRQSELRFISGPMEELMGVSEPPRPTHGIFFQAPLGFIENQKYRPFENLLNTWGYFLEFGSDIDLRPEFITDKLSAERYRFRIKELMEPSEKLTLYKYTSGFNSSGDRAALAYTSREWFRDPINAAYGSVPQNNTRVLAENVIALVFLPKLSQEEDPAGTKLAPAYLYDSVVEHANPDINSKNQLPPVVQVTMVALDEASAARAQQGKSDLPDFGYDSLYKDAGELDDDIATFEKTLVGRHLNFRVFTTNVALKGAKWSRH